ncbi:hypothetical protein ACFOY8_12740 [Thalassospira xianhensis]|uniref:Uncharacterized protein n=1 Tax=Thalassospira xianhensis MCCC 1A02616 TaxID=1177929 RepID=A0A367UG43_9PROT|nr:hypothetical protein [Thalassospira xianhensis]RCK06284.1 hypothetical protein TH5_08690 [Thalassospira xianhensis MCCC 1A02616]
MLFRTPLFNLSAPKVSGAGFGAPPLQAAATPVPAEDDDPDFSPPGFSAIDIDSFRPARVDTSVWGEVFPGDAREVRRRAGRLFLSGLSPDEAVLTAQTSIVDEAWRNSTLASEYLDFISCFPRTKNSVSRTAVLAASSIFETAVRCGDILKLPDDKFSREAFIRRGWHAKPGHCLVCGTACSNGDPVFQGDGIHKSCQHLMASIGPHYGKLVRAHLQSRYVPIPFSACDKEQGHPVDPDDPSTWEY